MVRAVWATTSTGRRLYLVDASLAFIPPVKQYLDYLAALEKSPHTLEHYCRHLKQLFTFLEELQREWDDVTPDDIVRFMQWLRTPQPSASPALPPQSPRTERTVNTILTAVSSFYRYHVQRGALLTHPIVYDQVSALFLLQGIPGPPQPRDDARPRPQTEGARRAAETGIGNIRWVQARAEELPTLGLGPFKLVTFGQSFHWTDRERVAETVYEFLEPGGALALMAHEHAGRPRPDGPGYPLIPHDAIHALIDRYLGPRRRAGQGFVTPPSDHSEDALARTRFGAPRQIFCPGRADIVRDADGVLAGFFSMSFCAPHLFGDRREQFEADFRAELARHSPGSLFWDWPGDTVILLERKPG